MAGSEKIFCSRIREAARVEDSFDRKAAFFTIQRDLAVWKYPDRAPADALKRLIKTSSGWPDRHRVSLPQLEVHLLAMFSDRERSKSRLWQRLERVRQRDDGVVSVRKDPPLYELQAEANADECIALELCAFGNLYHAYGCRLNDYRGRNWPGMKCEATSAVPYYVDAGGVWQLHFPAELFEQITQNSFNHVRQLYGTGVSTPAENP